MGTTFIQGKPSQPAAVERTKQADGLILLIILVLATILRLYQLNSGLWLDEILTYVNYAGMPFQQIVTTFDSENQHFVYSLLAHASFLLFGESAWSLRLPAVLFGVGSIGALYLLGKRLTTSREALLSAALLAFSYHHVWFSQNARGYTGLLFWSLVASWLFILALDKNNKTTWVLYAVSASLGMYTHLTMGFVLAGHFFIMVVKVLTTRESKLKASWQGLTFGFGLAGVLTLLLHIPVLSQMFNTIGKGEASVVTAWKSPIWTVLEIIKGLNVGFSFAAIALVALSLFGAGLLSYWKTKPVLIGLLVIPTVLGAATTIAIGHHLWPRFFFFAFGFAALVVIRGTMMFGNILARILRLSAEKSAWVGTLACAGLILISLLSVPMAYGPKQDYLGAMKYVNDNLQPGDAVVTVSLTNFPYQQYLSTGWETVNSLEELNTIRSAAQRTWLLYTFTPVLESVYPEIMESIRNDFSLLQTFPGTVGGGEIMVSRVDQPPASGGEKP